MKFFDEEGKATDAPYRVVLLSGTFLFGVFVALVLLASGMTGLGLIVLVISVAGGCVYASALYRWAHR